MREVDRGTDFNRLEETVLLSVDALYIANDQPLWENSAHAAGHNTVTDADLLLAQDKVEDQLFPLAATDTTGPVALQEAGNSR